MVETDKSDLAYYKSSLNIVAEDGTKLISLQEKKIYENLVKCNYLTIFYDAQIQGSYERKYAGFKIVNRLTPKSILLGTLWDDKFGKIFRINDRKN